MFDPSAPHIIILMIVVLLLFGSRRLPGAAKSLGQSMHIFKKSVAGLDVDEEHNAASGTPANPAATTLPPALPISQQPYSAPQAFTAPPAAAQAPVQDASAQIQELQRQVEELQRQTAGGAAGQSSQSF
jgi:sec-independent protein translocase protein TatA